MKKVRMPSKNRESADKLERIIGKLKKGKNPLQGAFQVSAEDKRKILRKRADSLAKEFKEESAGQYYPILKFHIANETYAVETPYVNEVHVVRDITVLPCTPAFISGIVNIRGQLITIINMKELLGIGQKGITNFNKAILLKSGPRQMGILSDEIIGLENIPAGEVPRAVSSLSGINAEYCRGVTGEGFIILDAEKILSDKRIIVHEEVKI